MFNLDKAVDIKNAMCETLYWRDFALAWQLRYALNLLELKLLPGICTNQ